VYVNGTDTAGDYVNATKQPIYAVNNNGTTPIANSTVVADANGHYEYYVPDGVYDEVLKYGAITELDTYIQMFDLANAEAITSDAADEATAQATLATTKATAAAASATAAASSATDAANSASAAAASATSAGTSLDGAVAAQIAAETSANASETSRSSAAVSETNAEAAAAQVLASWQYALNYAADSDIYLPADIAMTVDLGAPTIGTGTLAYAASTAAAPTTFSTVSLPADLEAGSWLRVSATGVSGFLAAHVQRVA
jgi:chemotaxis protein histidine kinase CheA